MTSKGIILKSKAKQQDHILIQNAQIRQLLLYLKRKNTILIKFQNSAHNVIPKINTQCHLKTGKGNICICC